MSWGKWLGSRFSCITIASGFFRLTTLLRSSLGTSGSLGLCCFDVLDTPFVLVLVDDLRGDGFCESAQWVGLV